MGANAGLNRRVAVSRGRGMFVNRSTRNANARAMLQQRTGRGSGGAFTVRQAREALANQGTARGGRRRTL